MSSHDLTIGELYGALVAGVISDERAAELIGCEPWELARKLVAPALNDNDWLDVYAPPPNEALKEAAKGYREFSAQSKVEAGVKYDAGKLRFDLVPVYAHSELARSYTAGAIKYGDYNWARGMSWSRVYAAIQRHLVAFFNGESIDPESKEFRCHHLAAAMWGCATLLEYEKRGLGTDDRQLAPLKLEMKVQ